MFCFCRDLVLFCLMELSYCAGCSCRSSSSPELHLCTSTRSYGLASDEISALRLDVRGRFKDLQKILLHRMWRQPGSDMRLLKAQGWKINPPPPPPLGCDSPSVGSIFTIPLRGKAAETNPHCDSSLSSAASLAFCCIQLKAQMLLVCFLWFHMSFSTSPKP